MTISYQLIPKASIDHLSENSLFFHYHQFASFNHCKKLFTYGLKKDKELVAQIHFTADQKVAENLSKSPFGGFDMNKNVVQADLVNFLTLLIQTFKKAGLQTVFIESFPAIYHPESFSLLRKACFSTGFRETTTNTTLYLPLTHDFKSTVKKNELRYINYAEANNFEFKILDSNNLPIAYQLIFEARKYKDYPVTMTLPQLQETFEYFPEHYFLYGLFDKQRMIATSLCIRINSSILYNFYNGDDLTYRKHSPLIPFFMHLTQHASAKGYEYLDLGVATDQGQINRGLYQFKQNLGGIPSEKPIYRLDL